jgi:hypothetical protein
MRAVFTLCIIKHHALKVLMKEWLDVLLPAALDGNEQSVPCPAWRYILLKIICLPIVNKELELFQSSIYLNSSNFSIENGSP